MDADNDNVPTIIIEALEKGYGPAECIMAAAELVAFATEFSYRDSDEVLYEAFIDTVRAYRKVIETRAADERV